MNKTPQSERLNIIILGACNSGKSSLINMIANQKVSLVSDISGTTTDPVRHAMELPNLGASVLVDTAGFDDTSLLGEKRVELSIKALDSANLALLLIGENPEVESEWISILKNKGLPFVKVANKSDIRHVDNADVYVNALHSEGKESLIDAIIRAIPSDFASRDLLGTLVNSGDTVLLVMPQDKQAPKGRLILPQSQTIRSLLDRGCLALTTTPDNLEFALSKLKTIPNLVITDSQAFDFVERHIPSGVKLTSFSILMAAYKGDIDYFVAGAKKMDELNSNSKVLIAEACTHSPASEDIGRVKIPAMLKKKFGDDIKIEIVSGKDFPEKLAGYDLIIHCGSCMFNRKMVMSRIRKAQEANVAMTNYGVAIAHLKGILDKVTY